MELSSENPENLGIPGPCVTDRISEPAYSAERSYKNFEELLQPIIQDNCVPNHMVEDLPSERLEDFTRASGSESDSLSESLSQKGYKESANDNMGSAKGNKRSTKKRGQTRGNNENLHYLDGNRWVPAVYHHHIRPFLIEEASRNGQYTYPRERGPDLYDVTSFLESQKNWGPVRDENWAEILYVFEKGKHHKDPSYELANWEFHGKIVIAGHDRLPMLRFRDVPDALSSALHGRDMEAMKRTDPRITQRDFMARMPLRHTTHAGSRMNVQSLSSIGMRMTRFRQQHGMLSWIGREGSHTIRNALWERLPRENQVANTIRGLVPPTEAEQRETRNWNAGKFLNRAGKRALNNQEREQRRKIKERRLDQKLRLKQYYNPLVNPSGQGDDTANNNLAPSVGSHVGNPFPSNHHSNRRGGGGGEGWNSNLSNLSGSQPTCSDPDGSSPRQNYPSPPRYDNNNDDKNSNSSFAQEPLGGDGDDQFTTQQSSYYLQGGGLNSNFSNLSVSQSACSDHNGNSSPKNYPSPPRYDNSNNNSGFSQEPLGGGDSQFTNQQSPYYLYPQPPSPSPPPQPPQSPQSPQPPQQ